jgi:hypothetical protein
MAFREVKIIVGCFSVLVAAAQVAHAETTIGIGAANKYQFQDFGAVGSEEPVVNGFVAFSLPADWSFEVWGQIGVGENNGPDVDTFNFANEIDLTVFTPRGNLGFWTVGAKAAVFYTPTANDFTVVTLAGDMELEKSWGTLDAILQGYVGDFTGYRIDLSYTTPTLKFSDNFGVDMKIGYVDFRSEEYDFAYGEIGFPIGFLGGTLRPYVSSYWGNGSDTTLGVKMERTFE